MVITDLKYDFNAIADLEERAGQGVGSLFSEGRLGFNTIRLLVWAGCKGQNKSLTLEQAGQAVQDYVSGGGSMDTLANSIIDAIQKSGLFENFTQAGE